MKMMNKIKYNKSYTSKSINYESMNYLNIYQNDT